VDLAPSRAGEVRSSIKEDFSVEDTKKKQIPAVPGFFTMPPEEPHLIGSKCPSCGNYFFPAVESCRNPRCSKTEPVEKVLLSRRGKLYSFTINHYVPPIMHVPDPFVPYANGLIELPEGIRVTTLIGTGYDQNNLKVGMEMEMIIDTLYEDKDGNEVVSWRFLPVSS
jgi:uncharacterized OB-fold protein